MYPYNPFSADRIKPGVIPFRFPEDFSAERLWEKFLAHGRRGQIVGAHGSGKSTLLATLRRSEPWCDQRLEFLEVKSAGYSFLNCMWRLATIGRERIVLIDGLPLFTRWQQWLLIRLAIWRGLGILVTTHQDVGLPSIIQISPAWETVREIVRGLVLEANAVRRTAGLPPVEISLNEVESRFWHWRDNVRELFFELYDLYELRSCNHATGPAKPA